MVAKLDASQLQEYRRYLYRYALQQVRDPELANDLVQDTFVAALEGGCRFEGRSAIRTWLVGILKHKIAERRSASRRSRTSMPTATTWSSSNVSPAPRPRPTIPRRSKRGGASGRPARRISTACPPRRRARSC
jgi:RNA polymerase sigma factor (sigma-70 family)